MRAKDVASTETSTNNLASLFGMHMPLEASPTKKVTFTCKLQNCAKAAKFAHKDESHDDAVEVCMKLVDRETTNQLLLHCTYLYLFKVSS